MRAQAPDSPLAGWLLAFHDRCSTTAVPFDWKFTRASLNDLMRRINARRGDSTVLLAA
jgi:hypothetical protein